MSNSVIIIDEVEEKLNNLNSNLSSKIDSINTNTNTINSNISIVKTTIDNIYSKIDTEISSLLSNTNANNTANLTGTLSQKLTYIANNLIGAANQTGGSYNTGTINAKLATLLLNTDSTTFTAGTNITKYNPITSSTTISYTSTEIYYPETEQYYYVSNKKGKYSFIANRNGSVQITITTTNNYGCNRFIVATGENYDGGNDILYFYGSSINNETKTINLNVKKGTKYYLDFLFCSENYNTVCTNLKVSYNININTSLL